MEAEYSIVHLAIPVGCDLPPPKSQHSREECGLALWLWLSSGVPYLGSACWVSNKMLKLCVETFPFCCLCSSNAPALWISEFHGVDFGWFWMCLNTHKLSQVSGFFWLLMQNIAKKWASGSLTPTPWAHIKLPPQKSIGYMYCPFPVNMLYCIRKLGQTSLFWLVLYRSRFADVGHLSFKYLELIHRFFWESELSWQVSNSLRRLQSSSFLFMVVGGSVLAFRQCFRSSLISCELTLSSTWFQSVGWGFLMIKKL